MDFCSVNEDEVTENDRSSEPLILGRPLLLAFQQRHRHPAEAADLLRARDALQAQDLVGERVVAGAAHEAAGDHHVAVVALVALDDSRAGGQTPGRKFNRFGSVLGSLVRLNV